jgi:hypothetical protein
MITITKFILYSKYAVENPGVAQIFAEIPEGVKAFCSESQRETAFWVLLHFY